MTNKTIRFFEIWPGSLLCFLLTIIRKIAAFFSFASAGQQASRKIVFVKFIEQGALVLHHNSFKEAAKRYGRENIYLVSFLSNKPLIEMLDAFDEPNRIFIDEGSFFSFTYSFFSSAITIRLAGIDSLIDLEFFSRATAIFSYLSGTRNRVGYHRYDGGQNYRGDLFTHRLSYSHYLSVSESSWSMLDCLSQNVADLPALQPISFPDHIDYQFVPTDSDFLHLQHLLNEDIRAKKFIVINPSFRDVLPLRAWPAERYEALIKQLSVAFHNPVFVFTGRADEFGVTEQFVRRLNNIQAVNLCGKTKLRDIFTLYTCSAILITSDSGPGHFASVTNIPAIVMFGPETPLLYAPKAPNIHLLYAQLPCSPCYNVYNNRMSPCKNNLCMKAISVAEVSNLATRIIRK